MNIPIVLSGSARIRIGRKRNKGGKGPTEPLKDSFFLSVYTSVTQCKLFAYLLTGSISALLLTGCTTPREVKALGTEVHQATVERRDANAKILAQIKNLSAANLEALALAYREKLEKQYWRMQFEIVKKADEQWQTRYSLEIKAMHERFDPQVKKAETREDELTRNAPDWPTDLPDGNLSAEQTRALIERLKSVLDSQVKAYQASLDTLNMKRQLASGYEESISKTLAERERVISSALGLNQQAYESALSRMDASKAETSQLQRELASTLQELEKVDKALARGTEGLRDYLLRKSELALFAGGLLKGLDLGALGEKVAAAVDKTSESLQDKLAAKVDGYVDKANKALENKASGNNN